MGNYRVFFPLVRQHKACLAGDGGSRIEAKDKPKRQAPKWDKPIPVYQTEKAVTAAILSGELRTGSVQAYDLAREYQVYLKKLAQFEAGFKPKQAQPRPNGKYNHVMFGGR